MASESGCGSKILAVTYGAGHVNIVIPVVKELEARGHAVEVLALTTAYQAAVHAGLRARGYRDFLRPADAPALELGRKLVEQTPPHAAIDPDESTAYLGINMHELRNVHGPARADQIFEEQGRQGFLPQRFLSRVLESLDPDLLLTTNSPRSERAAVLAAQARKTPSVVVMNLPPDELNIRWLGEPGYGTRLCLPSRDSIDPLVRAGRDPDELVITGNPAFDALQVPNPDDLRNSWRARHSIPPGKQAVLFASQPDRDPRFGIELARGLESARGENQVLIVRPHPNEDFPCGELSASTRISDRSDPLIEALYGCDSCIVICSTVGLQAALVGRPVVVLIVPTSTTEPTYHQMGVAEAAFHPAEAMRLAENHPAVRATGWPLGGSAARVADVAESVLP